MTETPRTGRSAKMIAAAVVVGLMGSGALVWQASSAAFTAQTTNPGNAWESGQVALTDDDSNGVMFALGSANLTPGDSGSRCIEVTYGGDVASNLKLYSTLTSSTSTALAPYLLLDVEMGDADDTCAGAFADPSTNFAGTPTPERVFGDGNGTDDGNDALNDFLSGRTGWANGVDLSTNPPRTAPWAPSASSTRAFKFTWTFLSTAGNAAKDLKVDGVDFMWEAQNS
jgi:hypothetical protein